MEQESPNCLRQRQVEKVICQKDSGEILVVCRKVHSIYFWQRQVLCLLLTLCSTKQKLQTLTKFLVVLGVPDRPRLHLVSTDSTSTKLEVKVRPNSRLLHDAAPPLWCSIFHRAKFGQPEETLWPARNLKSIQLTRLRCGTAYRSVFFDGVDTFHNTNKSCIGTTL